MPIILYGLRWTRKTEKEKAMCVAMYLVCEGIGVMAERKRRKEIFDQCLSEKEKKASPIGGHSGQQVRKLMKRKAKESEKKNIYEKAKTKENKYLSLSLYKENIIMK